MHCMTLRSFRRSTLPVSYASAKPVGSRPKGHALWHLPQLMQAVSSGIQACSLENARIALLFLTIGILSEKTARPIMGPPIRIFFGGLR